MPKYDNPDFCFTLNEEDSTRKWSKKHRTNYGSFALEPKGIKKRRQTPKYCIENEDGGKTKASVTRILGDALVLTYTEEEGYGLGWIDRTDQIRAEARRERRRVAAKARKLQGQNGVVGYNGSYKGEIAARKKTVLQRQTSAAA